MRSAHAQSNGPLRIALGMDMSSVTESGSGDSSSLFGEPYGSLRLSISYDIYRPATKPYVGAIYWDGNLNLTNSIVGFGYSLRTRDRKRSAAPYAGIGIGIYDPIGGLGLKLSGGYQTGNSLFLEANLTLISSGDYSPGPALVLGFAF